MTHFDHRDTLERQPFQHVPIPQPRYSRCSIGMRRS
jgi:hypothetical protein